MFVGILTAPFSQTPLEEVFRFASENGFGGIELAVGYGHPHLAVDDASSWQKVAQLAQQHSINLTSLAAYCDLTSGNQETRERNIQSIRLAIDAASELKVDTVCTLAGLPPNGKSKMKTIEEDCAQIFPPLLDYAGGKNIKIALENWYATNLQGLNHWEKLFSLVPHQNFGLNYDPSHLLWMDIDYINAVFYFKDRIFHTHAKDTEIHDHKRHWIGNQGSGWWRYVIPGLGRVSWGEYISALRSIGYDGTLSIEHEDNTFGVEEGFLTGKRYLSQFL